MIDLVACHGCVCVLQDRLTSIGIRIETGKFELEISTRIR